MTLRGARAPGTSTVTSTLLGRLRSDPGARQDLFALTQRRA
jgi:GTP cyclohydrolase IA